MHDARDPILVMDALARADRQGAAFGTTCFVTAIEITPMQTTSAAHAIGAALSIPVEVLDADRTNLNDLHHPSPLREKVEHAGRPGGRAIFVLRGHTIIANDRRVPVLAAMLGPGSRLVLAVPGEPPEIPHQVVCDLRAVR